MTVFQIISESDPAAAHRALLGTRLSGDEARLVTRLEAGSLAEAAVDARDTEPHRGRRIIAVEEIAPAPTFTDEELLAVLERELADPEELDDPSSLFEGPDFTGTVREVADILRDYEFIPGLELSLLADSEGIVDYSQVEIYDQARGRVLGVPTEIDRLIGHRTLGGRDGYVSIARTLLDLTADLH